MIGVTASPWAPVRAATLELLDRKSRGPPPRRGTLAVPGVIAVVIAVTLRAGRACSRKLARLPAAHRGMARSAHSDPWQEGPIAVCPRAGNSGVAGCTVQRAMGRMIEDSAL